MENTRRFYTDDHPLYDPRPHNPPFQTLTIEQIERVIDNYQKLRRRCKVFGEPLPQLDSYLY